MPGKRKVVQICDRCHQEREHFVSPVGDRAGVTRDVIDPICRQCKRDQKRHRIIYTDPKDKMGGRLDNKEQFTGLSKGGGPLSATQVDNRDDHMEAEDVEAAGYTQDDRIPRWIESLVEGRGLNPLSGREWRMEKKFEENIRGFDFDGLSPEAVIDVRRNSARKAVLDVLFPDWSKATGPDAEFQFYTWFHQEPIFAKLGLPGPKPTVVLDKEGKIRPVKYLTPAEKLEMDAEEMRRRWAVKPRRGPRPKNNRL